MDECPTMLYASCKKLLIFSTSRSLLLDAGWTPRSLRHMLKSGVMSAMALSRCLLVVALASPPAQEDGHTSRALSARERRKREGQVNRARSGLHRTPRARVNAVAITDDSSLCKEVRSATRPTSSTKSVEAFDIGSVLSTYKSPRFPSWIEVHIHTLPRTCSSAGPIVLKAVLCLTLENGRQPTTTGCGGTTRLCRQSWSHEGSGEGRRGSPRTSADAVCLFRLAA